jgi:cell division protein FtsW (lipid II flippase)
MNATDTPNAVVRRPVDTLLLALTTVTVALTVVQFALAGLGTFGEVHDKKINVDSYFSAHQWVGMIIGLLTLLVLIAALVARRSRRSVIMSVVLFVLAVPVQPFLGSLGADKAAWVGMLHALNGIAILGLAVNLRSQTLTRRQPPRTEAA